MIIIVERDQQIPCVRFIGSILLGNVVDILTFTIEFLLSVLSQLLRVDPQ